MYLLTQYHLPEQADKVVSHHHKIQCHIGCIETLLVKAIRTKIVFKFLDPVFCISTLAVNLPDLFSGQIQTSNEAAVAILFINPSS